MIPIAHGTVSASGFSCSRCQLNTIAYYALLASGLEGRLNMPINTIMQLEGVITIILPLLRIHTSKPVFQAPSPPVLGDLEKLSSTSGSDGVPLSPLA
jgi:hypothetical protein